MAWRLSANERIGFLFQQDYWRMKDDELELLAMKYGIPQLGKANDGLTTVFMRQDIIAALLQRDQALRTGVVVLGTLVSVLSVAINIALIFLGQK